MKILCLQNAVSRWFSILGNAIGDKPTWFLVFPLTASLILASGLLKLTFYEDFEELFTIINGRAVREMQLVESLFKDSASFFSDSRILTPSRVAFIQAVPRDDGSIFRETFFEDLAAVDRLITTFQTEWDGMPLTYDMICAKTLNKCSRNKVLDLASYIKGGRLEKQAVKYPIAFNKVTFALDEYVMYLGGVQTDDNGYLIDAKAVRLCYAFDKTNHSKSAAIRQWIGELNRFMENITYDSFKHSLGNIEKLREEMRSMSGMLLGNIPLVLGSIMLFTFLSSFTNNVIRSKPLVGASSCVSAALANVSGFGTCLYFGIPFTDFHLLLAYAILAIEVDDAFILIAAWRETNPRDSVATRMKQIYSNCGVSITITSITNFISFIIGTFSPILVVKYMCIYAAVTSVFSYAYMLTFFGGCLALDGYREEKRMHPIFFVCKKAVTESIPRVDEGIQEELFMKKFRDVLGNVLSYPSAKIIVLLLFFSNLAVGIWGLKFLVCGNQYSDLFNDNSTLLHTVNWNYLYFSKYSLPVHVIIARPMDYSDPKIQSSIDDLLSKIEAHPHLASSSLRISWLKYYKMFADSGGGRILLRGYNMSSKEDFIEGLHDVFLRIPRAKEFQEDVVFNENFTDIVASRFLIPTKDVASFSVEMQIEDFVHTVIKEHPLQPGVFNAMFCFLEQAKVIEGTTLTTAISISCLILLMFFLFVPNVGCSISIFVVVVSMFCETVGYMSLWGVKLDIVSLLTLIICLGFSINYPTHISFAFVNAKNMRSEKRMKHALYQVGMPVFQGTVSNVLGIAVLAFQSFYGVRAVFKVIFILTVLAAFHSLSVILILLGTFGNCENSLCRNKSSSAREANKSIMKGDEDLQEDEG